MKLHIGKTILGAVGLLGLVLFALSEEPADTPPSLPPLSAELVRTSATVIEARRAGGVPIDLALAVTRWEVRNADSLARGRAGEVGYFQIIPRYWRNRFPECYPERALHNPERNACIGVRVLREKYEEQGTWPKALKAYNGSLHLETLGARYVAGVNQQLIRGQQP